MNKNLGNFLSVIILFIVAYIFRSPLEVVYHQMQQKYFPCSYPITYRVDQFDKGFGISKADFNSALLEAEAIWEKPIGKNLFEQKTDGFLTVNLVYDNRQKVTQQLSNMGIVVKNDRASYDELKLKYDSLNISYQAQKTDFESKLSAFNSERVAYENEVLKLNARGGADKQTYSRLNATKESLNNQMITLNNLQNNLNTTASNLNALASELNQLAKILNINVKNYNSITDNLGGEFEEGLYTSDITGQSIDIYQFENRTKLVRVLAHELGHALGLDHNEDPKAIMYRLNNGINEKLTNTDLVALKTLCKIK